MSVPVITTKGTPWKDLNKKKAGWWIDHGLDPLVKTLRVAMSKNRAELDIMGKNGRVWMMDDFSWDNAATKMIDSYKSVLRSNKTQ